MDLIPGLPYDLGLQCLVRVPHRYFSSVASVCRNWKRQIEHPEFWRCRKASGLTRRVVVMVQARSDQTPDLGLLKNASIGYRLTVCEPETGFWAELPPIPGLENGVPMFCRVVGVGSDLVVMGGWDPLTWEVTNKVHVYSFLSGEWRGGADIPGCPRSFFVCASDRKAMVFVAGGHNEEKLALTSAMAYEVAGNKWIAMPSMARERDESKGVFHNGKLHVIGGYQTSEQGRFETSVESFDVDRWEWGPVREDYLQLAMCPRNCVGNGEGKVYMCRGSTVLALEGSMWRAVAEVPLEVRNTAYVTAWGDKLLAVGSERFGAAFEMRVLDVKTAVWERVRAQQEFCGHVQSGCSLEL